MSALLLARGFVGPSGKIVMIDTENGRGSLYADVIPGGYDTLPLGEPFHPSRYIEAMQAAEQAGAQIIVVDSMSHEWEGIGGVIDMAGEIEERTKTKGLHCWNKPKMEHAKMVQRLLRSPVPVICCIRAKYKSRQTKDDKGKTVILKDEATSPIQAEDFIFEMTAHAEILPKHNISLTKCSHPDLRGCFPESGPIETRHGELVAAWCKAAGGGKTADVKELKAKLWSILKTVRGGANDWKGAEIWLAGNNIITADQTVAKLTAAQLAEAVEKSEVALCDVTP